MKTRERAAEVEPSQRTLPFGGKCNGNAWCTLARHSTNLSRAPLTASADLNGLVAGAVLLLLRKYSGQETFQIGVLGAGDDRADGATDPTVLTSVMPADRTLSAHTRMTADDLPCAAEAPGLPPDGRPAVVFAHESRLPAAALAATARAPFDLAFSAEPTPNGIVLHVDYHEHVYNEEVARRAAGHLGRILDQIAVAPESTIGDLDILTHEERQQVLIEFNGTYRPYERDTSIPQLFAEQVRQRPEQVAVVHGRTTLTYRDLDRRVTALAAVLRQQGVRRGDRVALMLGKVPEMVVATLAILRVGGTYVPIDPDYPRERQEFLLADSGARQLVTTSAYDWPETAEIRIVDVATTPADIDAGAVDAALSAEDGAYIMYTSGTTGRPKGVLVNHRAVIRLVRNTNYVDFSPRTRILQTGAIVFDATTFELWGTLLNGGTLILVPDHTILDAATLRREISAHEVTTMWLTAPLFHQLVEQDASIFAAPLRDLLVGGDVLSVRHINTALDACPELRIINGYGPTENTTFSTTHVIDRRYTDQIPIGRPIANSSAYVLDVDGKPQPVGVPGELYVGGDGVSDGYLNRPELTARAFVPDPFVPGGQLYRTGDTVCWLPDGTIEFRGRADNQVKIRGFRVEPGEVEKHLLALPQVREAVVLVRQRAGGIEKYLCAYLTTDVPLTTRELRAALRPNLPVYMIPSSFVQLAALPLNRNGKVDRAALANHDETTPAADAGVGVEPRDDIERALADAWQATLGRDRIGVTENLFDLGVTSLTAAMLAAKINEAFAVRIPAARVLANPTIEAVANLIRGGAAEYRLPAVTPAPRRSLYPVTPQQRRIYVEQRKDDSATQYNVPVVVSVPDRIDTARFESAVRRLIDRHEILRTTYMHVGTETFQRVHDAMRFTLDPAAEADPADAAGDAHADLAGFVRPFDLARGPLVHAAILPGPESTRIALDFHHIAVDGISLGLLLGELEVLYNDGPLAPVGLQYKDFAVWQEGVGERTRTQQEPFWAKTFADPPPPADLPTDFPRGPIRNSRGDRLDFEFGVPRSDLIRQLSRAAGVTPFHTLVAIYFLFLARATGQRDLTVGTPATGRTAPEVERMAGMFANTLCLRAYIDPDTTFTNFLRATGDHVIEAFANQDYQFDALAERVAGERDYSRNPLFDTMIGFQDAGLLDNKFLGSRVHVADSLNAHSMFDLNLQITEVGSNLRASWAFSTALFRAETVRSFQRDLLDLTDSVIATPERRLGDLVDGARDRGADHLTIEFDF